MQIVIKDIPFFTDNKAARGIAEKAMRSYKMREAKSAEDAKMRAKTKERLILNLIYFNHEVDSSYLYELLN